MSLDELGIPIHHFHLSQVSFCLGKEPEDVLHGVVKLAELDKGLLQLSLPVGGVTEHVVPPLVHLLHLGAEGLGRHGAGILQITGVLVETLDFHVAGMGLDFKHLYYRDRKGLNEGF